MQQAVIATLDNCPACRHLRDAKMAHLNWLTHARNLLVGGDFSQDNTPLQPTDCKFGKWFYGEGSILSQLPEYETIDRLHRELHAKYQQVHEMLDRAHQMEKEQQSSLFRRLTSNSEEVLDLRREAGNIASELENISGIMLVRLSDLEKRIRNRDFI